MGKNKLFLLLASLAVSTGSYAQITGVPAPGSYYFKEVASGKFLGGANSWGTQASLKDHGIIINVTKPNGKYTLDTNTFNGASKHFFDGAFIDGVATDFEITETATAGEYTLKVGDKYLATAAGTTVVANSESDVAKAAKWQLIPVSDLLAKFATASFDSPADATFLFKGGDISRGWKENEAWVEAPSIGGDYENNCAEHFNKTFDTKQALTDVPKGLYRFTVQGFYRYGNVDPAASAHNAGTEELIPLLYANEKTVPIKSIFADAAAAQDDSKGLGKSSAAGWVPDNMNQASKAFTAGLYKSDPLYVYVGDDKKLTLGIKKTSKVDWDWTIFDNFELAYVGDINIDGVRAELVNKLAICINKAGKYTDDTNLQALATEASTLMAKVNQLVATNPDAFVEVANYLSGKSGNLGEQVDDLGNRITKAAANYDAYVYAMQTDGKGYKALETAQSSLQGVYDTAVPETQTAAAGMLASAKALVSGFKDNVEAAYKAGNAGTIYSAEKVDEEVASIKASLKTTEDAIKNGSDNAFSYANVVAEITKARGIYNTQAGKLYDLLAGAKDGDIYNDTYVDALAELNSYLRVINKVEEENKAKYDAQAADATTQTDFLNRLTTAENKMPDVYDKYYTYATNLRAYYKAACDDVESLTTSLKTNVEDAIGTTRDEVKNFYADKVTAIKDLIKALQANVDAANVDHKIAAANPFCDKYDTDRTKITDDISALKALVDESVAEFDANKATLTAIAGAEADYNASKSGKGKKDSDTFGDNYKGVDNLESADKAYTTNGRFAASEKSITDAIDALRTAAAAEYKVDGTGKARQFNSTGDVTVDGKTRKGLATINAEIVAYRDNAHAALDAYNKVANAIAGYKDKLNGTPAVGEEGDPGYVPATPGLVGTATNTDVTIDGALDSKSYKTAITELNTRIATIEENLGKALAKADKEHKTALEAIGLDDNATTGIAAVIKNLTDNYTANETLWNKNQVAAAKVRMLDEAQRRIDAAKTPLPLTYDAATYGKEATNLNADLKKIKDALTDVQNAKDAAAGQSDDAVAIAALSEVVKSLGEIEKDVNKLLPAAENAKTEYAAETTAKNALTDALNEIDVLLNGGTLDSKVIKSVNDLLNTAANFSTEISNQNTAITDLQTDIATSYTAETVRKDKDDTVVDGKVTKVGYTNRVAEIKAAVESLRTLAGLEADNKAAKDAFDAKVTAAKIDDDITQATTDIAAVATGDGKTFFDGELNKYKTEYNNIKADATAAYAAVVKSEAPGTIKDAEKYTDTSKNMKAKTASLEARLNAVKTNITGLKALADANEKAHNAQVAAAHTSTADPKFTCTNDVWTGLFSKVTNAETTSAHEAAIATLTGLKSDLKAYDDAVKKAWGEGKADTDKATIEAQLTTIDNALATFAASWNDTYAAAVAADNQVRKENFDAAYTDLTTAYAAAVNVITKLSKLSYAANQTDKLIEITGEGGIFDYATKIRTLKDDATAAFNAAQAAKPIEQFDAEEAYKALAATYKTTIESKAKEYTDEVNKIAKNTFTLAKTDAETKYSAAVSAIESTLYISNDDAKDAVKDVRQMIDNANAKTGLQDFAYILDDEILPAFATIDTKLTADKKNAAINTWNSKMSTSYQLAQAESKAIAEFIAVDGTKGKFSKEYANFVKAKITNAGKAWDKIAEDNKFAEYATPWALLNGFISTEQTRTIDSKDQTHTAKYWAAYDEDVAFNANDNGFEAMKKDIADVQKALDDAKAYIGAMLVEHNAGLMSQIGLAQANIKKLTSDAEGYHNTNTAKDAANQKVIKDDCKVQLTYIAWIIDNAIPAEEAAVNIEIGLLRNDYDRATAADIENTAIDAYKAVIDGYEKENAKIAEEFTIGKKDDKGKPIIVDGKPVKATVEETQAAFLALEKKIGVTKNELAAIYDAAATAKAIEGIQAAINGLNDTYADLETQLAECHEPVQAQYQGTMDAFKKEIDAAQAELVTETADNTVLLYEENNLTSIQNIANAYKNLSANIAASEAPYDVNDAKYAELSGQLATLTANLEAVNTAAAAYEYQIVDKVTPWMIGDVEYTNYREYQNAQITAAIAAEQNTIDGLNEKVQLITTSTVNKDGIQASINFVEQTLAYYNAAMTESAVSSALSWAKTLQDSKGYASTDKAELNATYNSLSKRVTNVYNYNSEAITGTVNNDIDGNVIKNDKGVATPKTVKYMEEYPAIMERLAEIATDVEAYANDVNLKSYIKGDVNHDQKVNVADYSAVRNIALGFTEVDPASAIFYAADVNYDGEITVADVTAIAQFIMKNYWPAGAGSRSALKNRDAISVAMTANNGKQQVVISLNNKFEYVAAQMDIQLPAGMKLVGESLTSRANGHELLSNDVNGAHRVLISTLANNAFFNTEAALVVLDVEVTDEYQGGMIQVNNAIFADASAHGYKLADVATGETTGIDALSVDVKNATIYDFSGRRVFNVKKGNFYIINGKSVLVK